jgi:Asp-tRNA(Asn)/Glu-tRNA(Gln) amidotransferase B subunit
MEEGALRVDANISGRQQKKLDAKLSCGKALFDNIKSDNSFILTAVKFTKLLI